MMRQTLVRLPTAIAIACLCIGSLVIFLFNRWEANTATHWPTDFSLENIKSSMDGSMQPAYFFASMSQLRQPLVVSLHTWSGNYAQHDPLARMVRIKDWNYIHPDFRGPNSSPDACLSDKAIRDIDDSIQYAIANGNVDRSRIFVTGMSGGGYAAIGSYMRTKVKVNTWLVWAPISDLSAWFYESKARQTRYYEDILNCTSASKTETLDVKEARSRSPLYWEPPPTQGRIEIYTGINDGHTGTVPISHSLLFFNRLVKFYGYADFAIPETDIGTLLRRERINGVSLGEIGGRRILYARSTPPASITIFDGGHEMLTEFNIKRITDIIQKGAAIGSE